MNRIRISEISGSVNVFKKRFLDHYEADIRINLGSVLGQAQVKAVLIGPEEIVSDQNTFVMATSNSVGH